MNIDTLKLKVGIENLEWFNKDLFIVSEQYKPNEPAEKTLTYKLDVQKGFLGLKDITINQTKGFLTIEVSAKMLKENYFELINIDTAENLLYNINELDVVKLNHSLINTADVLKCDVTNNLILPDKKTVQTYLKSLSTYMFNTKYSCSVYQNESIVFDKRVKSPALKEHLTFYYKYPEIQRDSELLKYVGVESCKTMLRCESKYANFEQMRTAFKVNDLKLITLLKSAEPVNFNILNRITGNIDTKDLILIENFERVIEMKREVKKSKLEKMLGMLRILEMCSNDIDAVKIYLGTNSTANNSKSLREYRVLLKSLKECESNNTIQKDITEIRNYLQVA